MPFSFGGCCWPCCCVTAGGAGVATGGAAGGGFGGFAGGGTEPESLGGSGFSAAPLLWTTAHTSILLNSGDKFLTALAGDLLGVWNGGDNGGGGLGGDFLGGDFGDFPRLGDLRSFSSRDFLGGDLTGDFLRLGDLRSLSSSSFCSLSSGMVARSFLKFIWIPPS